MKRKPKHFKPTKRSEEKAASRAADAKALANGTVTVGQLRLQNDPFARYRICPDWDYAKKIR